MRGWESGQMDHNIFRSLCFEISNPEIINMDINNRWEGKMHVYDGPCGQNKIRTFWISHCLALETPCSCPFWCARSSCSFEKKIQCQKRKKVSQFVSHIKAHKEEHNQNVLFLVLENHYSKFVPNLVYKIVLTWFGFLWGVGGRQLHNFQNREGVSC